MLDFFPSGRLTLYLAKTFITRILAVLVMLVIVLLALDLLAKTGDILAVAGNTQAQVWHYAELRLPQLIQQFLPYSVLLATIITLLTLNQNSEVIAMKAAGLSAHQVLAPLLLTALIVSGVSFVFNERIVTRATASLKAWEASDYAAVPEASNLRANVYVTDGEDVLSAASQSGVGNNIVMRNVTWYDRDPEGQIVARSDAATARFANPGWVLENGDQFRVQDATTRPFDRLVVGEDLTVETVGLASVDPDTMSFFELKQSIDAYEEAGRRTSELKAKWWHKLSGPLSAFLMPLLGAIAAFGLARSGQLFVRAIIGMALGFAYSVVDNAALAMGSFGGYPPLLAAWAPFVLFALIGETVLIRTEE